ncbi:NACHT domain-containing protein [Actinoplanes sp. CA-054009]
MQDDPRTLRGALAVLRPGSEARFLEIDRCLGHVLTAPAGRPLMSFLAWIQSDSAASPLPLLHGLIAASAARLPRLSGRGRLDVVTAMHTAMLIGAFTAGARAALKPKESSAGPAGRAKQPPAELALADREVVAARETQLSAKYDLGKLYDTPVPDRLSADGRSPMSARAHAFFDDLGELIEDYAGGTSFHDRITGRLKSSPVVRQHGFDAYQSAYNAHLNDIAEFRLWASSPAKPSVSLDGMATLADALEPITRAARADGRTFVNLANADELDNPIVQQGSIDELKHLRFPLVREIYVTPGFRVALNDPSVRAADEDWWKKLPDRHDLELFLAAHLCGPAATTAPIIVLGHPGAGKSLFTKVVAARLPPETYTVVRVPLRSVDSDAQVHTQIQQALDAQTHKRVRWSDLVEQSRDTVRVVLLDGLDELLQANPSGRSSYLLDVAEFQRREAALDRPVIVMVTSRTVVVDRARLPDDALLVRLSEFTTAEIDFWVDRWNTKNGAGIEQGALRRLTADDLSNHLHLACQPLLLLLLAIYIADPKSPGIHAQMSTAALYKSLFASFIRRELRKDRGLDETRLDRETLDRLWKLAVAAFAMFNRSRLFVTDDELGADLMALAVEGPATATAAARRGQHLLGQFFFIYTSEADTHRDGEQRHSYEFLHATFGEYLVGSWIVELLAELARAHKLALRSRPEIDDSMLFALTSCQPIANRRTILEFAREAFAEHGDAETDLVEMLDLLIRQWRSRTLPAKPTGYRPTPVDDHLRELATYTANLVLMRVFVEASDEGVALSSIAAVGADPAERWRSLTRLWHAGLDATGMLALTATLELSADGRHVVRRQAQRDSVDLEIEVADLAGDRETVARLLIGRRVRAFLPSGQTFLPEGEAALLAELAALATHPLAGGAGTRVLQADRAWSGLDSDYVVPLLIHSLAANSYKTDLATVVPLVRLLLRVMRPQRRTAPQLALVLAAHPQLLEKVPELREAELYAGREEALTVAVALQIASDRATGKLRRELFELKRKVDRDRRDLVDDKATTVNLMKGVTGVLSGETLRIREDG